ncbi:hypothetical protein M885DRAFT_532683 [Pelagophyceae sp. CCMP2097]|nr:hypothetical protein M885DRAFT_532683 [Pelagophyceae sp. CCMP2097]
MPGSLFLGSLIRCLLPGVQLTLRRDSMPQYRNTVASSQRRCNLRGSGYPTTATGIPETWLPKCGSKGPRDPSRVAPTLKRSPTGRSDHREHGPK